MNIKITCEKKEEFEAIDEFIKGLPKSFKDTIEAVENKYSNVEVLIASQFTDVVKLSIPSNVSDLTISEKAIKYSAGKYVFKMQKNSTQIIEFYINPTFKI